MPEDLPLDKYRSYLLLFESELIRPDNWNKQNHQHFQKIFTWNDEYVDQRRYFKFNFTHSGPTCSVPFAAKTKFCTLIAGNKSVDHPFELYSKRIEAIRWFEKYHPEDFEFYGMGWDLHKFTTPLLAKVFNRIPPLRKKFSEKWPSYRGSVRDKLLVLKNYRFSICYENAYGIPGYVTEKIFDSLSAGCIPIYWGAPNIKNFIPANCFIDRTAFRSYEDLYFYLKAMSASEYDQRLAAISAYLVSEAHRQFEPAANAQSVAGNIIT
ncbi:MAG: hypothetical protein H7061_12105 [Bdellovibrionaceae bacterium]|nr:hypothetical protein [Bdellovibrio sp.]